MKTDPSIIGNFRRAGLHVHEQNPGFYVGTVGLPGPSWPEGTPPIEPIYNTISFEPLGDHWALECFVTGGFKLQGELSRLAEFAQLVYGRLTSHEVDCLSDALAEVDSQYAEKLAELRKLADAANERIRHRLQYP